MGKLIDTGVGRVKHMTEIVYEVVDETKKCFLVCECGWRVEIKAYRNYGGVIETRIRYDEHLESLGLRPFHPKPKTADNKSRELPQLERILKKTDHTDD